MLERILREIPKLTDAVVRAEIKGNPSFDVTKTGAADTVREAGEAAKDTARTAATKAKRRPRQARKVPGVAQAEGQIKGAVASEDDLAIARYDKLTAEEITGRLPDLSQIDLAKIDSYERKNQNRTTILSRITSLRGNEPWAGYDELTAAEVQAVLSEGDDDRAQRSAPTSAATRTARACCRRPNASSPAPDARTPRHGSEAVSASEPGRCRAADAQLRSSSQSASRRSAPPTYSSGSSRPRVTRWQGMRIASGLAPSTRPRSRASAGVSRVS